MRGTAAALTSESGAVGTQAATAFGGGFNRVLSGGLIAAGVVAATGAALIAVGTQFDDAYDRIQTGTGATGDALEGLKDVFRGVVADVPTDFASAADAITLLNQRLEVTGAPLEELSEQFLNLSNITGDDLNRNVDAVTRAFGDWSVATADQSDVLDRFFVASQESGVAVGELAEGVVQFGSPLRQLGFSLDESIALFASFGEAGVNTSTVMSGMRQAVKNFASGLAENETGVRNFGDVLEGVRDGTFDLSDAMTVFGARAGADMFAAIQEGRFDLEDFIEAMRDSEDAINNAAKDTRDFGESFDLLKNNIMLLLEGPATRLMDWLSDAAVAMADFASTVREEGFGSGIGDLVDDFKDLSPAIQGVTFAVGTLTLAFVAMKIAAALAWVAALGPIALVIAGTLAVAAAAYLVVTNWETVKGTIASALSTAEANIPGITGLFGNLASAVNLVTGNLGGIPNAIGFIVDLLEGDFSGAFDRIVSHMRSTFGLIPDIVGSVMQVVGSIISAAMGFIGPLWNSAWSAVTGQVRSAWESIKGAVQSGINSVVSFLTGLPNRAGSAISGLVSTLTSKGREAMQGLLNAVRSAGETVVGFFRALPGRIVSAIGAVGSLLVGVGANIMEGLLNGIQSAAGGVLDYVRGIASDIAGAISGVLGIFSPSRVMMELGSYTMEGLEIGMQTGWQRIAQWLRQLDPGAILFGGDAWGSIFDIDEPTLSANRVILDIQDAWRSMRAMFADMPFGFIAGTQAGNDWTRAIQDQAARIRNYVDSLVDAGDFDGASAALTRMVNALRDIALASGMSSAAVDALITSLFGTLNLDALVDDLDADVERVNALVAERNAISSRYSGESAQTRVVIEAGGVDSALVEWLRRSVRVESGGDVQAFLGA